MKNFLKICSISLIILISLVSISMAETRRAISEVNISDIDVPYTSSRTLDTTGKVEQNARYRIIEISWTTPTYSESGLYEVTVIVEANIGYMFDANTIATLNEGDATCFAFEDGEKLSLTYIFDSTSVEKSDSSFNYTKYLISVYSNTNKGKITPNAVRVLKGKSQTFEIIPNEGYKIKDVKIDGESIGPVSEYTFKKVKEDHSIKAYFEEIDDYDDDYDDNNNDNDIYNNAEEDLKPMLDFLLNFLKIVINYYG